MPTHNYLDAGGLNRYHTELMSLIVGDVQNVAPFFSVPVSSLAWATSGDTTTYSPAAGYWHTIPSIQSLGKIARFTNAPANAPELTGYAKMYAANELNDPLSFVVAPGRDVALPEDTDYTLMLEWSNMRYRDPSNYQAIADGHVDVAILGGDGASSDVYDHTDDYQIVTSTETGTMTDSSGVLYFPVTTRANYGTVSPDTGILSPLMTALLGVSFEVPTNTIADGLIRLSLYPGTYAGKYKQPAPWAFFGGLRGSNIVPGTVTLDRLSSDVQAAIQSISELTNGDTASY